MQANQLGSPSSENTTSHTSELSTKSEKLTYSDQLRVLKGNFNFLVINYLGLTNIGYNDNHTGEYHLAVDKIHEICTRPDSGINNENCPIERAVRRTQTKILTHEGMAHSKILGESAAHVWDRAKILKSKRKDSHDEGNGNLFNGEVRFSHSYMSTILSAFPFSQTETVMDIFDAELEKIEKMAQNGTKPTLYALTIQDGIAKILTKLPDGLKKQISSTHTKKV